VAREKWHYFAVVTQREWLIQIVVRATHDEADGIAERIGEVICVPAEHEGSCRTPWVTMTSSIDDEDEPRRSELLALLEDE
jgi:hypothetical protein